MLHMVNCGNGLSIGETAVQFGRLLIRGEMRPICIYRVDFKIMYI